MKHLRAPGAAALLALVLVGCAGDNAPVAPSIRSDFAFKPWDGVLPAPGDGIISNEKIEVCKFGSNASFAYTATNLATNVTVSSTINMNAGECWVLAVFTKPGMDFSITETTQAGFQLDHVDLQTRAGLVNNPIVTTTSPTVTLSTGGGIITGVTIKFYNVATPATGSIGDFVWNDLNGNGVQDGGEPGLAGVTVTLSGAASASTTTDANGAYLFSGLSAGAYTVTVNTPAGYNPTPSGQGGDPLKDSNGSPANVTLATSSSTDLSVDFGFRIIPPPPPSGRIGDFVWDDLDGDGVQDAGEPGIPGVTVTLSGAASATTTTDINGFYVFGFLSAGSYTVTVGTPAGYNPSPSGQGGDPLKDSNGSPASVTLPSGSSVDVSIDFGFVLPPPPPPPPGVGRMTGGGAQIDLNGVRISRGLTLHCDITLSNNLEINWPGATPKQLNNFHITRPLTSAVCILDPAFNQPPPAAPFNTFIGVAQGTLNGIPGATARFTFIDAGEPGRDDLARIEITDAGGNVVLNVPLSNLTHGNIQAHYDQPHKQ